MTKILIVEDEETIRLGLKYYLEAENRSRDRKWSINQNRKKYWFGTFRH